LVGQLGSIADPSRAFAFRGNPELLELAERSEGRLAPYGYGPEGRRPAAERVSTTTPLRIEPG
jgi:hypothetical protein